MERKRLCQGVVWLAVGVSAVWLVNGSAAQETLGRGRTPAQTFASDCAVCHKSPQGLARSAGGLFGVEGFLREHYTSSREFGRGTCELSEIARQRTRPRQACGQK